MGPTDAQYYVSHYEVNTIVHKCLQFVLIFVIYIKLLAVYKSYEICIIYLLYAVFIRSVMMIRV
jgi:hypothetical protein